MNVDALLDRLEIVNGVYNKPWSQAEDAFLQENLGRKTDAEIGLALGRSEVAVHLRWKRDLHLPAPSKDPRYMTARGVARALGVDDHKVTYWIEAGLLPGEKLAGDRLIRRTLKTDVVEFALNSDNWVLFDPGRVSDPNLRRLISQKAEEWGDAWWMSRQVADHWGVDVGDVKRAIQLGRLKTARRVPNRGGRDRWTWANWFILRSEAAKVDLRQWKRVRK